MRDFASLSPSLPLQQTPGFLRAALRAGLVCHTVGLAGAERVQILRRKLPFGMGLGMVSRGPVWHDDTGPQDRIAGYARLRRLGVQIINAETPDPAALRAAGYVQVITSATVAQITLDGPNLAQKAHPKWRSALRRAQNTGLHLRVGPLPADPVHWLLEQDRAQQRAKRFRAMPHELTLSMAAETGLVSLYQANQAGQPVAAMAFVCDGGTATYHIGWSSDAGRTTCAHHLILAHAAADFAAMGVQRLDLGLVQTDRAPGLARFKIGTGAALATLGGTWICWPARSASARSGV